MNQPYRVPARKKKKKRPAARELTYAPGGEKLVTPARSALKIFFAGSFFGSLAVLAGWVIMGIVIFGLALVLAYRSAKKPRTGGEVVLSIEKGRLKAFSANALEPHLDVMLEDVSDVTFETRSIQRGGADIGALSGLGGVGGSAAADLARITIIVESEPRPVRTPLTDEYFPRIDGIEWLGKIRTFLRSHRWLPEDERVECEEAEKREPADDA